MFWIPLAIGAAAGIAKAQEDKKKAARQRNAEAATAAYSPWTGMKPNAVQEGSGNLEGALQGASTGAALGQGMEGAENAAAMNKSQMDVNTATADYYNRAGGPKTMIAGGAAAAPQIGTAYQMQPSLAGPEANVAAGELPPKGQYAGWGPYYQPQQNQGYYLVGGGGRIR